MSVFFVIIPHTGAYSGPFENLRESWITDLQETSYEEWPPGSKLHEVEDIDDIPKEILDEIMFISERDSAVWDQCVCVTSEATESFVSPPAYIDDYGHAHVKGWSESHDIGSWTLVIHPVCLAFVCRHNGITPKQLWESFFESSYDYFRDDMNNGLLHCVDYYEMDDWAGQSFEYNFEEPNPADITTIEAANELQWLLGRPTLLPAPQELQLATTECAPLRAEHRVFGIPELLDNILDYIIEVPIEVLQSELKERRDTFEASSAIVAAKTLLSLAQVNRSFYQAIVGDRQGAFLRAIKNFGWMLPFTPADWADSEWPDKVLEDAALVGGSNTDWRSYMLKCVHKATPNIRNRWRLHKMAVQFGRGGTPRGQRGHLDCIWNAGSPIVKSDLQKSVAEGWEVGVKWW
ncbi:hypothetical protein FLONG3_7788 [Fusarium longipes]|uniref:Uncharacterized protein n=1 Tax=Fusarium longipes TaxID=694270 RepID=A0A395SBC4_9HYPO|nr:hypothetical protein FLONG3_7788 [Fusarium longipes]